MTFPLLTVITFTPLFGALVILFLSKDNERTIKNWSVLISLLPLAFSIYLWFAYNQGLGGFQFQEVYTWIPQLGSTYHMAVDGLSVPLIFLTALLTTLGLYYSAFTVKRRVKEFFLLFLLLEMGMFGVFVSLDYVLFYVFWEIGLVPMYFLIAIWGQPKDRPQYAAIKFFIYTLVGSVAMLLAILAIYFNTGTFDIVNSAQAKPFANNLQLGSLVFWGLFLGFAIKVPSFPFHTWLPDAHTAAPTAGSVILAGVLLKLGAYGFLRIVFPTLPNAFQAWSLVIVLLGVVSIIYGAFVCMAQWDLKRLIAYSSVSHMGYVMLGIGAAAYGLGFNDELARASQAMAINGAALQMFNHGIITGGLFFMVGVIYERAHTRELKKFGGLSAKLPYFYGIMLVTSFASLGLPGLAGFWSEFLVFRGAFDLVRVYAAIGVIGIVVTAAYILWKIIQFMFLGEFDAHKLHHWTNPATGKDANDPSDMATFEKVTMWPLVAFMVLFGIYPTPLLNFFNLAAVELLKGLM